jgi:hypothetical protein
VYLYGEAERELRLAATSLAGGGLGGEYRIGLGQGFDGRAAAQREPLFLESSPGRPSWKPTTPSCACTTRRPAAS